MFFFKLGREREREEGERERDADEGSVGPGWFPTYRTINVFQLEILAYLCALFVMRKPGNFSRC
jgi:hypothetical protein